MNDQPLSVAAFQAGVDKLLAAFAKFDSIFMVPPSSTPAPAACLLDPCAELRASIKEILARCDSVVVTPPATDETAAPAAIVEVPSSSASSAPAVGSLPIAAARPSSPAVGALPPATGRPSSPAAGSSPFPSTSQCRLPVDGCDVTPGVARRLPLIAVTSRRGAGSADAVRVPSRRIHMAHRLRPPDPWSPMAARRRPRSFARRHVRRLPSTRRRRPTQWRGIQERRLLPPHRFCGRLPPPRPLALHQPSCRHPAGRLLTAWALATVSRRQLWGYAAIRACWSQGHGVCFSAAPADVRKGCCTMSPPHRDSCSGAMPSLPCCGETRAPLALPAWDVLT
ncbi:hypothetical protein BS78_05G089900 [Paspalum vaginatum]|nr:hypothetical protein BS78_05G089900 [Paspalum vaginatum]